jgi:uncharacterized membrane protein
MEHVEEVSQTDDTHLHWKARIAGREHEWDAQIVEQTPDEEISWRAQDGIVSEGSVHFEPVGDARTKVRLHMHYAPEGVLEKAGVALGGLRMSVARDLASFKQLVENEHDSAEGWRGEVHGGQRVDEDTDSLDGPDQAFIPAEQPRASIFEDGPPQIH